MAEPVTQPQPDQVPTRDQALANAARLLYWAEAERDLVTDPFAGVGSTLVAAILTGRRAYGVEIEERYATIALDRVRRAEALIRQTTTI